MKRISKGGLILKKFWLELKHANNKIGKKGFEEK
jgi:hypothetical protein